MFDKLKSLFQPQQRSDMSFITVTGAEDYSELPQGFFRVETASGKESLGYKFTNGEYSWRVGETVVDGLERVTLAVPRESLPLVKLPNFSSPMAGEHNIGGHRIIDTDSMPGEFDGETGYDGVNAPRADGWI